MGLFKRNKSVDLDEVFKTKYKEINKIIADGQNEFDLQIQISLYILAYEKYNDLLELIDQVLIMIVNILKYCNRI